MEVRTAVGADARGIAEVHVRSWQAAYRGQIPDSVLAGLSVNGRTEWWAQTLGNATNRILVAVEAGMIVAFVNFGPVRDGDVDRDSVGEVYAIYCLAEFWDRGLGRKLMEVAVASLRDLNYAAVKVWVLDTNSRAIAFYRKLGFSADGAEKVEQRGKTIGSGNSATAGTCAPAQHPGGNGERGLRRLLRPAADV